MLKIKMNKINKITSNKDFIVLILVVIIISNTIALIVNNTRLETELKAYKVYYNASEALFNEIEDYNENLFDTDRAVNYYTAKSKLNNNK